MPSSFSKGYRDNFCPNDKVCLIGVELVYYWHHALCSEFLIALSFTDEGILLNLLLEALSLA